MNQPAPRHKPIVLKRLLRLLLPACAAFYLIAGIVVSIKQRWFIYVPPTFSIQQGNEMARVANLDRWRNAAGQAIGLKRLSPRQPADGTVLIVYGNGSCAVNCAHYADGIQTAGAYDVFILEYPGYGDRPGSPSQSSLFQAAEEGLAALPTNQPVYVMGESLGSGVASYLAGRHPDKIAGMVLLSPFNRLTDVAQYHMPVFPVHLILIDRYPSEDYLHDYHGPVGVVLDGHDSVVPEKFGLRLYDSYAGPKKLWEFALGEHTAIVESPEKFWGEAVGFWRDQH